MNAIGKLVTATVLAVSMAVTAHAQKTVQIEKLEPVRCTEGSANPFNMVALWAFVWVDLQPTGHQWHRHLSTDSLTLAVGQPGEHPHKLAMGCSPGCPIARCSPFQEPIRVAFTWGTHKKPHSA